MSVGLVRCLRHDDPMMVYVHVRYSAAWQLLYIKIALVGLNAGHDRLAHTVSKSTCTYLLK